MANRVLTFHYTLTDDQGQKIDSSQGRDPLSFLEGKGHIIPKLEAELAKMKVGDKKTVKVGHKDAYGEYNAELIRKVSLKDMPKKNVKVGDEFEVSAGNRRTVVVVTEVTKDEVTLDGNHPLAGKDLTFDVELTDERPATAEELSHGHAHGPGGHHH
ncbi:MAG TPA: peptidylprolyl isomerase [Bdellovibrionales bacterium]|nr:peptidylprolyl isomerase [Bdellovibrionales bacterium]